MHLTNTRILDGRFSRPIIYGGFVLVLAVLYGNTVYSALFDNGFDLSNALIPVDEVHHGGPPRDGIPAIDDPVFLSVEETDFLADSDRVLGLFQGGMARAYPIRILDWHEIVNDDFGGEAIVISYCPLCGTGMAFRATVDGRARNFGVSGLLYNSDVLLYDRESESLWSQLMRKAVSGPLKGQTLEQVPMAHTTWRDWRTRYPNTAVLSTQTGHNRDYSRSPYGGYERSEDLYFPVANQSRRYHPKELVIGINLNGGAKAYPFAELSKGRAKISDKVGQQDLTIEFDSANRTGRVIDKEGVEIPSVISFWFAWFAFYPGTEIYTVN